VGAEAAYNGWPRETIYGRSLERHLKHVGLVHAGGSTLAFAEWVTPVQGKYEFKLI